MAHRRLAIAAILAFALAAAAPARAQLGTRVDAPPRAPRRPRLHALPPAVDLAADAAEALLREGLEPAQNRFHALSG